MDTIDTNRIRPPAADRNAVTAPVTEEDAKTRILAPGRNCRGIYAVDQAGLVIDGRNYFRAFYDCARRARHFLLIAGWQFERSVPLLRGFDLNYATGEVIMASFLNELCERNPALEIFILMWDFNPIVAFDKEWFNKFILDITTSERIHFRFDSRHAMYASHHQKLVVIDGVAAFVGGLDLAANSWDDRKHWSGDAERVLAGEEYEPYHDVQSFQSGPIARELTKLFEDRWINAGGEPLGLVPAPTGTPFFVRKMVPLKAHRSAVSITRGQTLLPLLPPIMEIRRLYLDAIARAESLIYIETQYFSSQAVYEAIRERLVDRERPCPEIVIILPRRLHTIIEDISLSVVQAKMLRSLTAIAARFRRPFGVYYTAAAKKADAPEIATYIHSKVMVVDDRFLSVGSANMTNRSMGMDTELNVSWESTAAEPDELARCICRIRGNLLAEHTGLRKLSERRALRHQGGLVEYLNSKADRYGCRLRRHTMESFLEDISWIKDLMPEDLSIDPERPIIEESIYEIISRDPKSIFARGFSLLNQLTLQQTPARIESRSALEREEEKAGEASRRRLDPKGRPQGRMMAAIGIGLGIAVLAWLIFDR